MVNNIITYSSEYAGTDFERLPFNEVDSLIFCQLSYLNYAPFVKGLKENDRAVSFSDIYYSERLDELFEGYWYKDENRELFKNVALSGRYGKIKINYYENVNEEKTDTQFSAVTFMISPDETYIAYRGTDASLIGWKEDLKLAYSKPINAQKLAAAYLMDIAALLCGKLYTGGHSKGGNLAVYAAMNADASVRDRIINIFDHDGPGFRPELLAGGSYNDIKKKIKKYIPRSSVVGIILEDEMDYEVIDCWSVGTLQHNTYTWKSENGAFIRAKEMTDQKKLRDAALNEWILSLSESEIDTFIDTFYEIITATDAKNVFELKNNPRLSMTKAGDAVRELDEDTKKALQKIFKSFIDIYGAKAEEEFKNMQRSFKDEVQSLYRGAAELIAKRK